jgi:hypothetical protein
VCSITHGAILLVVAAGPDTPASAEATAGNREEAMAPTAATKNSEQKMRRHFDGVNVGVVFEFVIIELPVRLVWLLVNGRRDHVCSQSADVCQTFSGKSCILKHEPCGCWTKEKKCLRLISHEVLWECDASSHRFRPD